MEFTILKQSQRSQARLGKMVTDHGTVSTPIFMPIGTHGVVKNIDSHLLKEMGAEVILANAYHLLLRPGGEFFTQVGGLHSFMNFDRVILTDSGGFQVFSLSQLRKLNEEGVVFCDPRDGSQYTMTPEESIQVQRVIGADIMMCFDECPDGHASYAEVKQACDRTTRWAYRCRQHFLHSVSSSLNRSALFGIVQGGRFTRLRTQSAHDIGAMGFDGYAIGGVSVGENRSTVRRIILHTASLLPPPSPHYLMGMGRPEEIVFSVKAGMDMFDCVIPTREARHGRLYMFCEKSHPGVVPLFGTHSYHTMTISQRIYESDLSPVNPDSQFEILRQTSRAYLHYLFSIHEGLAFRLMTMQNLEFYLTLMRRIQDAIHAGEL